MIDSIKKHKYKEFEIHQMESNTSINGTIVPATYVNLSQMCLVRGKKLSNYFSNKETLSFFIDFVEAETIEQCGSGIMEPDNCNAFSDAKKFGLASGLLIQTKDAIGGDGAIYGHYEIAIDVAQWVDSKFRVWANKTLRLVLSKDFIPVTEAARLAEQKLKQYRDSLFGGLTNIEYVDLAAECRADHASCRFGMN